jgi:hypothetical protein
MSDNKIGGVTTRTAAKRAFGKLKLLESLKSTSKKEPDSSKKEPDSSKEGPDSTPQNTNIGAISNKSNSDNSKPVDILSDLMRNPENKFLNVNNGGRITYFNDKILFERINKKFFEEEKNKNSVSAFDINDDIENTVNQIIDKYKNKGGKTAIKNKKQKNKKTKKVRN